MCPLCFALFAFLAASFALAVWAGWWLAKRADPPTQEYAVRLDGPPKHLCRGFRDCGDFHLAQCPRLDTRKR